MTLFSIFLEFRETSYAHWKEGTRAKTVEWFKEELNLDVDPVYKGSSGPSPITGILMQYVGVRLGQGPRVLLRMRRISIATNWRSSTPMAIRITKGPSRT